MSLGKAVCPAGRQYLDVINMGPDSVPRLAGPRISLYQLTFTIDHICGD